jgi:SAM-dependent methyltransferase
MKVVVKDIDSYSLSDLDVIIWAQENHPNLYDHLNSLGRLEVLDVGCGIPLVSFFAYHIFSCSEITLVDIHSEKECIKNELNNGVLKQAPLGLGKAESFYDCYEKLPISGTDERPKIESKEVFDSIFIEHFEQEQIQTFVKSNPKKYDLVFVLNVFHFLGLEMESTLKGVFDLLTENGVLLIRVQRRDDLKGNQKFDYDLFKKTFNTCFKDGVIIEFYKDERWDYSICMNRDLLSLQ